MKYLFYIIFTISCQALFSQSCNLAVTISNLKGSDGEIVFGLYNNKSSFPLLDKQYRLLSTKVKSFSGTYTIKDLPIGEYALAIFHDKNSDSICNTNFLGVPKEGYGFSRNFRPKLSKPTFDDCKFDLKSDTSMTIILIY
jgi:uncharacterized protein (DUF2141 family)